MVTISSEAGLSPSEGEGLSQSGKDPLTVGQKMSEIPRLEGDKLLGVVNHVLDMQEIITHSGAVVDNFLGFEPIYLIGLENPNKIWETNIPKLYESSARAVGLSKNFDLGVGDGLEKLDADQIRLDYVDYAIERFGRDSDYTKRAIRFAHHLLSEEFMAQYNVPCNPDDI